MNRNKRMRDTESTSGITLAQIAVVIVVIGLFAGMAVIGGSYKSTGEAQKDISQLEKYQSAAADFRSKYGYLPGDLPAALAVQLKFVARDGSAGRGDGNNLLEGNSYSNNKAVGSIQSGEPLFFWEDIYSANLIKDPYDTATDSVPAKDVVGSQLDDYLPDAHIGNGNRIYVYSDGKVNYFGISSVVRINGGFGTIASTPGLTAAQAYDIDKKVDDGIPTSGKVVARYLNVDIQDTSSAVAAAGCYSKSSTQYSVSHGPAALNCALSFAFE